MNLYEVTITCNIYIFQQRNYEDILQRFLMKWFWAFSFQCNNSYIVFNHECNKENPLYIFFGHG